MRLAMSRVDFFSNNRDTKYVDRICAFLDISTDRLKIVGVREVPASGSPSGLGGANRRFLQSNVLQIEYIIQGNSRTDKENAGEEYVQPVEKAAL